MAAKKPLTPRKTPKQARSAATVQAILDATAQVLVAEGFDKASTNRIARAAGVSVGSLYQYFPNKEALVAAVVDRWAEAEIALLADAMVELAALPVRDGVPRFLKRMLESHARDPAMLTAILQQTLHLGIERMAGIEAQGHALVAAWIRQRADEVDVDDPDATAQVLTTAVTAVAHARVFGTVTLDRDSLEQALTQMVLRILGVPEAK